VAAGREKGTLSYNQGQAMRTTWNGSISFGLVNIPIGLAPATKPAARASDVSFRLLHRECKTPIKQKRWCPVHDREVGPDEIVKGWEVSKGEFVIVEEDDLEAIERDSTSRAIDITGFVPEDTVDPIYFDRTYFLVPAAAVAARRPYVLLQHAMQETGMAALGRFVLAGKEKLCMIRAHGESLALETMYLAEDVYSQAEIDEAVAEADVKDAEVALARQIIDSMVTEFQPADQLTSEYRQDLRELLDAKLKGKEPVRPVEPIEDAPVVDLMEALRRSVEEAQKRKEPAPRGRAGKPASARRRTAKAK
jgi:DNA end-binding protein Ku